MTMLNTIDAPTVEPSATQLLKTDEMLQVVWGVVYAPGIPDSQGDFATAVEIQKAAYAFMAKGDLDEIDLMHNGKKTGAFIVESFIVREGDPIFSIPGSWVIGVHIPDAALWARIMSGELNGFSMEAMAIRTKVVARLSTQASVIGRTELSDGHTHTFEVQYDETGELMGGRTSTYRDPDTGREHFHNITKGTATDVEAGHSHRFASIEDAPRVILDEVA